MKFRLTCLRHGWFTRALPRHTGETSEGSGTAGTCSPGASYTVQHYEYVDLKITGWRKRPPHVAEVLLHFCVVREEPLPHQRSKAKVRKRCGLVTLCPCPRCWTRGSPGPWPASSHLYLHSWGKDPCFPCNSGEYFISCISETPVLSSMSVAQAWVTPTHPLRLLPAVPGAAVPSLFLVLDNSLLLQA